MAYSSLATALARCFLAGEATVDGIVARASATLGKRWRWLRPLAKRFLAKFGSKARPRRREVVQFLLRDVGFERARRKSSSELAVAQWPQEPRQMQPVAAAASWHLPEIETAGALADWLRLSYSELEWFADLKGLARKNRNAKLRHYNYRVLAKQFGSVRLIEAPKPRLKQIQRQILTEILNRVPSHPVAHGFLKGRSIKTFAAPHVGRRVALRMDLQDFFPTLSRARIQAFFRTAGYPETVADLLGGLCTHAAPPDVWSTLGPEIDPTKMRDVQLLYARPHLPQGAPTSPALANLCAFRVDCRLTGLAQAAGVVYTRYADDLAFSGDEVFEQRVERFSLHAAAVLLEEGFNVHHRKTRIMRQGVRQYLAGLVTNAHINVVRADFDRLKAILTNCVRHGPASQNREAHPSFRSHLEGRVGFVEMVNPAKGERLRKIFNLIQW
jgi:hypothetical protein